MRPADAMVLLRSMLKQVARRHGYLASLMCRPPLPNVLASGWHLHQSLLDGKSKANAFAAQNLVGQDATLSAEHDSFSDAGVLADADLSSEDGPIFDHDAPGQSRLRGDYDVFADLFRGRGEGGEIRMPPQDLHYALAVDFLDAVNGTHKVVAMLDGKTLDITIPAGINDGQVLRLKGQGLPGSDGKPGDAYVEISVRPHAGFKREGHDILSTLPVSLGEALNGASVHVNTVDGPVDVKVPKDAKEGAKLRLRGKGVSHGKVGGRGDHLVEIHIVPPEGADEALAQFMAEWEKTHPQNPRRKGAV